MNGEHGDAARSDALEWSLTWTADGSQLQGELTARNVSDGEVTLGVKPGLKPVGRDGEPLAAETFVTLEYSGPPVVLPPGAVATASVGWGGWDGPRASPVFVVQWDGGEARVTATGPCQPTAIGPATNLTAGRYRLA
jgi:hypothetical protein